jgi:siderophore synthetase component
VVRHTCRDSLDAVPRHTADARANVLAKLWGALAREPIPGLGDRTTSGDTLRVALPDGHRHSARSATGPAAAAQPFAAAPARLAITVDGVAHDDPATLLAALRLRVPAKTVAGLSAELDNSVANLALARSGQPVPDGGAAALARAAADPDPLAYLEQSVVDGHPLHPCCRSRTGMSEADVLRYAPEHRPVVDLIEVRVPAGRWYGVNCEPLLYVHPWQYEHVADRHPWLHRTGVTIAARPLMSLRTLAVVGRPHDHVKTAVDVQMTSAVRTVSAAAVHNGPVVSRLLSGLAGRTPTLSVLAEVASGAALVDGEPSRSLAMVGRTVPVWAPDEVALPLAVLAARSPADGRPIVVELVRDGYHGDPLAFVDGLARLLLPPLLILLELGVALEAHGQNLLVVVRSGRLAGLAYRDMGGLRISPDRLRRHGIDPPELRGDLACDDPDVLRTKVFASAVSTVLAETIVVLARELDLDPEHAWGRVAAVARGHGGPDVTALFAATLPIKATTAMRLAADPLEDVWAALPNPMGGLA